MCSNLVRSCATVNAMPNSRHSVLLIDDDVAVRQSISTYLEDSGFDVTQAASGFEGVERLKTTSPDVILTDLRMPGMDGKQVMQEAKSWKPETPVIVVSGMGVVKDVVEALRLGAADYLVKPLVDMEMLVIAIKRALERRELKSENLVYREQLESANKELREMVRTLERDQKAGRAVQRRFLPDTPVFHNGYKLEFSVIPSLYLSGDMIDYGLIEDRFIPFYLADVSGHGAASAFVTIWLKQQVRRYIDEGKLGGIDGDIASQISLLLSQVNSDIVSADLGCHLTCFVGVVDSLENVLYYSLGGHLPLPVMATSETTEYLEGKGKAVGIFEQAQWQTYQMQLPEEFELLMFSDGVLEVLEPSNLIEKEQHLIDVLQGNSKVPLNELEALLGLRNTSVAPDDIAMFRICRGKS